MRSVIETMTAYTLRAFETATKLNQNESPCDFPVELKQRILEEVMRRQWNRYPEFESITLRRAIGTAYDLAPENVLVGNGSNELLMATIAATVGPGTPVIVPRPSFSLYEKLVTIAGGTPFFADVDPRNAFLPADSMLDLARGLEQPVIIACSPNNPTGGVLPQGAVGALLETGATLLLDRAYGDFAEDVLPATHDRLVTFSTFSKAWGLAGLRVGWLATSAATAAALRKVMLPYNLNIISETAALVALQNAHHRDANVTRTISERTRVAAALASIESIEVFPSAANFIAFRVPDARRTFDALRERGVLVRDISSQPGLANSLRVSIGSRNENDEFLNAIKEEVV